MAWQVVMEEDGVVTLPPDLIAAAGWTTDTQLHWIDEEGAVSLAPIDPDAGESHSRVRHRPA